MDLDEHDCFGMSTTCVFQGRNEHKHQSNSVDDAGSTKCISNKMGNNKW